MIHSNDPTINEAGIGLKLSVNRCLPSDGDFFVQQPLPVNTEDGPFVACLAYGLVQQQTSRGAMVQVHPTLIIGRFIFTLDEVGRGLALAKEWFSLVGLASLANHYGFTGSLSLQEADRIVGSSQFRLEDEAYGLARVCQAYEKAKETAIREQGSNPEHPFLLKQYEKLYTSPELEKIHPNALRAVELASEYISSFALFTFGPFGALK